jgi:transcriptional regulator with XRE-family HTH domain/tetratricopeptide (TPR) repeat protein
MSTQPAWTTMPAVTRAASSGDFGTVLRTARVAAGLTLQDAARLAGVSASTLSRMETKRHRAWDVRDLRRLAEVFAIPPHLFGLSRPIFDSTTASLSAGVDEDGDPMRRRDLLATTAAVVTGATVLLPLDQATAAQGMADTIEDVLFGRAGATPIPDNQLAAQIAAARADFRATRYSQLARRLPRLLAQAVAGRDAAAISDAPLAAARLAQTYTLATELLIKLHDNGMAWATADRAVQAASAGNDPVVLAQARRLAATVMRRTHHRDGAQRLMLDAASQLQADTGLAATATAALYGQLLAAASYTAALRDDRDSAWTLLGEAEDAARRVGAVKDDRFNMLELAVYKISVSRVLGDFGTAVDYARMVDPARITSPERRARYWEDTALALHGRGRPQAAYQALVAADRDTPQEVRFRPWAQQLTRDLLSGDRSNRLPGLREFATRVGTV